MEKVVIIGAGPAGVTAAYELLTRGAGEYEVYVLEQSSKIGGISQTVNINGNYMDMGGHRFFSKSKRVTDWWDSILSCEADPEKTEDAMLIRERMSRIYYKNNFFDYPVSFSKNTIKNLGIITACKAGISYLATVIKKLPEDNLENFYINRFGKILYSLFFEGYTEKLWGRHPREISAEWGAQRVKGISVLVLLKDFFARIFHVQKKNIETSLIEKFYYPKYGPGQLWTNVIKRIEALGGKVMKECEVNAIYRSNVENRQALTVYYEKNGKENSIDCDIIISSMPIKNLIQSLENVPEDIKNIALGLPYRDFMTVGVLLPQEEFLLRAVKKNKSIDEITPDCWIYVQDSNVKLGRIQIFNNWSPYMVKDNKNTVWLGLEYFCNEGDEYWTMSDEQFINFALEELVQIGVVSSTEQVILTHREKVRKAYPAYFDTYTQFDKVREYLNTISGLWCIGRNGQHRYNNMDHSMLTAFLAVDGILSGNNEKTKIWNVNTEASYHENYDNKVYKRSGQQDKIW